MNTPFSRTFRAVEADSARGYIVAIAAATVVVTAITIWLFFGSCAVYASSTVGAFEAADYAHPLSPQVAGMISEVHASLGQNVAAGDILFVLDSNVQQRALAEEQARRDSSKDLVIALQSEIEVEQRAREAARRAVTASTNAAQAKVVIAQAAAKYASQREVIIKKLNDKQLLDKLESLRGEQEDTVNEAQLGAQKSDAASAAASGRASVIDREAQIAELNHQLVGAEGVVTTSEARIAELDYEIERRKIRASIAGVIADLTVVAPGATVQGGEILGSIVPHEPVHVITKFDPAEAVGRIEPGQNVILRVDQFPWTQFGVVDGRVTSVGIEPRDKLVRVDIDIAKPNPRIPISHGLTGVAEVSLERARPIDLFLRLAGQQLSVSRAAPTSTPTTTP